MPTKPSVTPPPDNIEPKKPVQQPQVQSPQVPKVNPQNEPKLTTPIVNNEFLGVRTGSTGGDKPKDKNPYDMNTATKPLDGRPNPVVQPLKTGPINTTSPETKPFLNNVS